MRNWLPFALGVVMLLVLCLNACFYFQANPVDFSAPSGLALITGKNDGGGYLFFLAWRGRGSASPVNEPAKTDPAPASPCPTPPEGYYGRRSDGTYNYPN